MSKVKLKEKLRKSIYERLSKDLSEYLTPKDFDDIYLFLNTLWSLDKVVPYKVYENLHLVTKDVEGVIFKKWLEDFTKSVSKGYNKGRKLVRYFNDLSDTYKDTLVFTLKSGEVKVYGAMLRLFLVEIDSEFFKDKTEEFITKFKLLRDYILLIYALDLLEPYLEEVLSLLIVNKENVISSLKQFLISKYN